MWRNNNAQFYFVLQNIFAWDFFFWSLILWKTRLIMANTQQSHNAWCPFLIEDSHLTRTHCKGLRWTPTTKRFQWTVSVLQYVFLIHYEKRNVHDKNNVSWWTGQRLITANSSRYCDHKPNCSFSLSKKDYTQTWLSSNMLGMKNSRETEHKV